MSAVLPHLEITPQRPDWLTTQSLSDRSPTSFSLRTGMDCTPRVRHQNQGQVAIGVWFAAAPDPGWWFDSAQQAASERAPHSAVASERLAVVVAPCAASCERWLASNSIGD